MPVPSIKATAFQSVADDLERLRAEGRLAREEIEAALAAEDLRILEEKLAPTAWVPIATYDRAVRLLLAREAPTQPEAYLRERGRRAAERLAGLGIYTQLEATTDNLGVRVGHIIVSLARAIYNFSEWHYEPKSLEEGFTIRVEGARELPEVARFTSQGFVEYVASRAAKRPVEVASERPDRDTVLYVARPA